MSIASRFARFMHISSGRLEVRDKDSRTALAVTNVRALVLSLARSVQIGLRYRHRAHTLGSFKDADSVLHGVLVCMRATVKH